MMIIMRINLGDGGGVGDGGDGGGDGDGLEGDGDVLTCIEQWFFRPGDSVKLCKL